MGINKEALVTSFVEIYEKKDKIDTKEALNIIMRELLDGQPPTPEQTERAEAILEGLNGQGRKEK